MHSSPITGAFNDAYIAEMYERFRSDPALVEESWRQFFRTVQLYSSGAAPAGAPAGGTSTLPEQMDGETLRKVAGAAMLIQNIRTHGHYAVRLDPLGTPPIGAVELTPEFHRITEDDLNSVPASAMGFNWGVTAADVVAKLRGLYSSNMGFETEHMDEDRERQWFRRMIEEERFPRTLTDDEKRAMLKRLSEVDGFERFIGRAFLGHKRFSIEGNDLLVPMLDELIESASDHGAEEVAMAVSHRGRLNVLAHILGKGYASIFGEFAGDHPHDTVAGGSGDVKYHMGAAGMRRLTNGKEIRLEIVPNPSHLGFVNPVVAGLARARQQSPSGSRDARKVLPVFIHGDAAFSGEGVIAETFNMARLSAYTTGGTIHIIVNNQIGYTTEPSDARSTHYASDLAKGFDVPVVHVSADDPEACIAAVRLASAFRAEFGQDFVIDLVGYRRHGHNEADEPSYTQPDLYADIKSHAPVRQLWAARLISDAIVTAADVAAADQAATATFERALEEQQQQEQERKSNKPDGNDPLPSGHAVAAAAAPLSSELLVQLNERMLSWPGSFTIHPKLARQLERRRKSITAGGGIDWGHAEALAFASLLQEGTPIRLTGQDAERGTFSHRHAVLHDYKTGDAYLPLQHIAGEQGTFEIHNSPLTETSVLAFEYGYSTAAPAAMVFWEAQFGDFVNIAQPIMDQFIFADRTKWGQSSSLILLLPHGYEGQGPEHSSARLERFLQSCAEGNMIVAYPTTPAQYFHILRRQSRLELRRPLVLMQPKSLLRLPEAASSLQDLSEGSFRAVLEDASVAEQPELVRRLVFCSGKIHYDIIAALAGRDPQERAAIAVTRVEELYPWPHEIIGRIVDRYPGVEEIMWAQEEPRNMGAWTYALPRLHASAGNLVKVNYVGRPERASTAEGYKEAHDVEQKRIVDAVIAVLQSSSARRRGGAVRT